MHDFYFVNFKSTLLFNIYCINFIFKVSLKIKQKSLLLPFKSVDYYVILVGRRAAALPPRSSFLCAHRPSPIRPVIFFSGSAHAIPASSKEWLTGRSGREKPGVLVYYTHLAVFLPWFHEHPLARESVTAQCSTQCVKKVCLGSTALGG